MHKVTNWDEIKKQVGFKSFLVVALPPLTVDPAAKIHARDLKNAGKFLSPKKYGKALKQFMKDAEGDPDLAMFLSLRSPKNERHLVATIHSALRTFAYREEGIKLLIYMMQDMAARGWTPKYVEEKVVFPLVLQDSEFFGAIISLYGRYYKVKNGPTTLSASL
uniref:Uncharacterized protein n=1 Tax=Peronospora matthiolae TaxID=2874970 RepID=A0AAV1TZH4_9STRA